MSTFSSFGILSQEQIQTARRLSALLAAKGFGAGNAVWEEALGAPPMGAQNLLFHPHDHCEKGVPLARSSQYSFGADTSNPWSFTTNATNTWQAVDQLGNVYSHADIVAAPPNIRLYVTPNIDSDNTAVGTSPCALFARLAIRTGSLPGTNPSVRIYNRTTDSSSSSTTLSILSNFGWYFLDDIPCKGGQINDLFVEFFHASTTMEFGVIELNIAETRTISQPASSGSATLTGATKP